MSTPGEWLRDCPYCEARNAAFGAGSRFDSTGREGLTRRWQFGWCPICGGVVVMELEQSGAVIAMYPARIDAWAVAHLPASVSSIWGEAGIVFGIGAYRMAVVACGRTLEQAAIEREIEAKTLQKRIEKMQEDGLITREFRGAMDYVRVIRNVGAHAGQEVSRDTADGTMRFTQQTLRLLFEVPGELRRLMGHPPEAGEDLDAAAG